MTGPAQSIGELVQPLVTSAGLELWDVEVNPRAVRVLVDRPGGVDLDALSELARQVSDALDGREDLVPGSRYQLEVSSPGVDRVLRTPEHFGRFLDSVASVKTVAAIDGCRRFQGRLVAADDAGISLDVDGQERTIAYREIQKAHTVLMWGAQPKVGTKGGGR